MQNEQVKLQQKIQELKAVTEDNTLQDQLSEYAKFLTLLSKEEIGENEFIMSVAFMKIDVKPFTILIEMRDELVQLGLKFPNVNKKKLFMFFMEAGDSLPKQENLLMALLNEGMSFADIKDVVVWFEFLPSIEAVKFMLFKGLGATTCLSFLVNSYVSADSEEKKIFLVDYVLDRGADPNGIVDICNISLGLCQKLITKKLDSTKLLNIILNLSIPDKDLEKNLVQYALDNDADPSKVISIDRFVPPSKETCKLLIEGGLSLPRLYALVLKGMEDYLVHNLMKELLEFANKEAGKDLQEEATSLIEEIRLQEPDPEKLAYFSKLETIKTWVASEFYKKQNAMKALQHRIVGLLPQNRNGYIGWLRHSINNGQYGNSWPINAVVELKILKKIHELSCDRQITVLEIGAGSGCFSWKIPLAFEKPDCKFYVNEFMNEEIEIFKLMSKKISSELQTDLLKNITFIPGDCLEMKDDVRLIQQVDVVIVNNVEHFFTPSGHKKLFAMIGNFLIPGGFVYCTALSPIALCFNELFSRNARRRIAACEMDAKYAWLEYRANSDPLDFYNEITALEDDCNTSFCERIREGSRTRHLFFTPKIYRNAITSHGVFDVEEVFITNVDETECRKEPIDWINSELDDYGKVTAIFKRRPSYSFNT